MPSSIKHKLMILVARNGLVEMILPINDYTRRSRTRHAVILRTSIAFLCQSLTSKLRNFACTKSSQDGLSQYHIAVLLY